MIADELAMTDLLFVDTETTGLDADVHEIWEVGITWVRDDGDWDTETWQLPVDLGRADPIALKIGRFYERRQRPEFITPIADFAETFERVSRGRHLVGAVVSFDEERLRRLLRRSGACPGWHYHLVDVENIAAGTLRAWATAHATRADDDPTAAEIAEALRIVSTPPWNSEDLSKALGVDPANFDRHTALGDALWAKAMYEAVYLR